MMNFGALSLALCVLSFARAEQQRVGREVAREFAHVDGQRLIAPDGRDFQIRAIGTGSTAVDPSEKDYEEMARLKFNAVTVFLSYKRFYNEPDSENYIDTGWKRLEQHLVFARKFGLRVILQMLVVEGAQFVPSKGEAFDYRIWVQPQLQERRSHSGIKMNCKSSAMAFSANR